MMRLAAFTRGAIAAKVITSATTKNTTRVLGVIIISLRHGFAVHHQGRFREADYLAL
jgi:hypothetical protein